MLHLLYVSGVYAVDIQYACCIFAAYTSMLHIQGVSKVADTLLELGSIHFRVSTTVVSFILSKFVETQ
jgi:hypothetical protein